MERIRTGVKIYTTLHTIHYNTYGVANERAERVSETDYRHLFFTILKQNETGVLGVLLSNGFVKIILLLPYD